jgi:hypothetical protein
MFVLENPSTDLYYGHAHTQVFRHGWIFGFSSSTIIGILRFRPFLLERLLINSEKLRLCN